MIWHWMPLQVVPPSPGRRDSPGRRRRPGRWPGSRAPCRSRCRSARSTGRRPPGVQVIGMQFGSPHTLVMPVPPQVCGAAQLQSIVRPQPSPIRPQYFPPPPRDVAAGRACSSRARRRRRGCRCCPSGRRRSRSRRRSRCRSGRSSGRRPRRCRCRGRRSAPRRRCGRCRPGRRRRRRGSPSRGGSRRRSARSTGRRAACTTRACRREPSSVGDDDVDRRPDVDDAAARPRPGRRPSRHRRYRPRPRAGSP